MRLEKAQTGLYQLVDTCLEHLEHAEHVAPTEARPLMLLTAISI